MVKHNLIGFKVGRLEVKEFAYTGKQATYWLCLCICGTKKVICGPSLTRKKRPTLSCGCLQSELSSAANKGAGNPNYNPNLTDEDRLDRLDRRSFPRYKKWVQAVLKRDNYTCQICGSKKNLVVHHLESYNSNPKLRTKLSNGATVCEKHHLDFHHQCGYGNNTKKQFEEFKNGNR